MATTNPYDRREQAKRRPHDMDGMMLSPEHDLQFAPPMALAVEDLNALALSVHSRGRQQAIDELRPIHREEKRAASHQAWSEGHATGHGDGQHDLLNRIAEQYEDRVRSAVVDAQQLLADEGAKAEQLRPLLSLTCRVLGELIESHHNDFAPPALF